MKIEFDRFTIRIIPENEQDVAFIEDTMGLSEDGSQISIERIDSENINMGFRLETDLPLTPKPARIQTKKKVETFERPLEDFIDIAGSWDGPPYKRSGDTKRLDEIE
tara:strand:+ start:7384 stop:7704 length:321 start_codon:yes stop_codon:yes gene_type:complete